MGRRSESLCRRFFCLALVLAVMLSLPLTSFTQTKQTDPDKRKGDFSDAEKDNPFERLKAQEASTGKVTPAFRDKVLREAQKHNQRMGRDSSGVVLGTPGQATTGPAWVNIGPTGSEFDQNGSWIGEVVDSGRLRTILTHPTDGNIVYVLSSAGGLWKTTNFESARPNWTPLTDFLPTTAGGAASFGRTPDVIYLGLGDPYDQITVGGSIVKSSDGGTSWSPLVTLGNTISVRDVKVDTSTDTDIVLVATDGGLWRSADAGAHYGQVTGYAFQDQYIWSLTKTSAGWLMSTAETMPITNGTCTFGYRWCTGLGHIYLSTDKGASWVEQTQGLTNNFGRTTLASIDGGSVVYAFAAVQYSGAYSAAVDQRDLFRSSDGGKTWVALGVNSTKIPVNTNGSYSANMNVMTGQAWYNQTILVDPSDPTGNTVYLGGTYAAYKTTDGGATWRTLSEWLYGYAAYYGRPAMPYVHADMHTMAYKAAGTPMVLLGSDGGIFASPDNGNSWDSTKNTNLITHMFYSIIGNPLFPNFAMGGLQDNGTRVRVGNTGVFNQSLGGDGFGVGMSQANTETSFQSVYYNKLQRWSTRVPPQSYTESVLSLPGQSQSTSPFNTPIISPAPTADPSGLIFFSQGLTRLYKTVNGGLNWVAYSTIGSTPGLSGVTFRDSPFGLGVSPTNINHLAVGTNGGRVYVSTDGGTSWTYHLATDNPAGWPGFVSGVTWGDDNTIWVASNSQSEGLYTGVPTARVVKSSDQGATWVAAGNGLPDVPVTKVLADPRDVNVAYAATHVGVYRTTDGGANWLPYGTGLPNVRVNDLYMPPDGGYLRIATYGRGLWQLSNLDYMGAALVGDGNSCDQNDNIGNNETGHLMLTFTNPSAFPVAGGTVTVTSDNPHLTFTAGNNTALGTVDANGTVTASLAVKVQGATGIEPANLTIAYGDSAVVTLKRAIKINYDDNANGSATTVDWESQHTGWTISSLTSPKPGDNFIWERRELTPVLHTMAVTDANADQDTSLVSPVLHVGAGNFSFSFNHRFVFENGWDGGMIDISTDNGATWNQITGTFTAGGYNAVVYGSSAWTGTSTGWPATMNSAVDLGTAYANQDVRIRFHATADSNTGGQGWEISDATFVGLTNSPFGAVVAHNETCPGTTTSLVSVANPSNYPDQVTFTATIAGGVTPATGTVTFKEGSTVIGTANAVNSIATITTSTLAVGTHYLVAQFAGDAEHVAANSASYKHTVLAVPLTTATPSTLDFGDLRTGTTSAVKTSILKNTGTAPLVISGITASGDFTQTNNCSTFIAANGSCTISVKFKPVTGHGARTGAVTVASNASAGDVSIALTGNATAPQVSTTQSALTYASTLVGDTTAAQVVTITNEGNIALNISAVGISGDFAQTNDCTTAPIAAGASCTISATFTPTVVGARTGTITLTDDADDAPQSIALTGTGAQSARISLSLGSFNFGAVRTGQVSPAMTTTLTNSGTTVMTITGITASSEFGATNDCAGSLAPGASCTISITFSPVGVQGSRLGTVTLATDAIAGPTTIGVNGVAAKPVLSMSSAPLSYANTLVGSTTAAQVVTITNSGNMPLTFASVGTSADFAKAETCTAAPVAAGATCTVNVSFAPAAIGNRTGTLTLTTDADNSPQTVALSGKGENLQISGTTSQTVSVKSTATYPLTLKASTALSGVVTLTCAGAPARTTCAFDHASPTMVAGGTSAVSVTVVPAPTTTTAAAAHAGQLFFASFGLFGMLLLPLTRKASGRKVLSMVLLALVITVSVGGMVACGSSSSAPVTTPTTTTTYATPGTYTITVTASSAGTTLQTQTLTLTLQ